MSWIGLTYKGIEPLYPDEWNRVIDALNILYDYSTTQRVRLDQLEQRVEAYYLECKNEIAQLEDCIEKYYIEVKRELTEIEKKLETIQPPTSIETYSLNVTTLPVPLSQVDRVVKRIHIKVPSWAMYIVYLGSADKQDFILEPGDKEVLEVQNPKNIYVRSLGNVTIHIALET